MKTIIRFFTLIFAMSLLTACDPPEGLIPSEVVFLCIKNHLLDTVNVSYMCNLVDLVDLERKSPEQVDIDSILPYSEVIISIINYSKNSIRDTFKFVLNERMQGKKLIITTLADDTLANWNDSSVVFTDKRYWTIEERAFGITTNDINCTLNLTDEVLKLK